MKSFAPARAGMLSRRGFLAGLPMVMAGAAAQGRSFLPERAAFIGLEKFEAIIAKAAKQQWSGLPMGPRVAKFGMELLGAPYASFTLEIDDRIESPSANFNGMDCWTFFEIALGLARLIERPRRSHTPAGLLAEIEWTRYRGGVCQGGYLDRIHYLDEWFHDNEARDNIEMITHRLGPAVRLRDRRVDEMTVLWRSYRYLKNDPSLLAGMRHHEARLAAIPFHYIPKERASAAEAGLQSGDIIGIVTRKQGVFCSHVGLALRDGDGVCRFMHASQTRKMVLLDKRLSEYLAEFKNHAGFVAARPLPVSRSVTSASDYSANLRRITGER